MRGGVRRIGCNGGGGRAVGFGDEAEKRGGCIVGGRRIARQIDKQRRNPQVAGVDDALGARINRGRDGDDSPAARRHIDSARFTGIDIQNNAAANQQIKGGGSHRFSTSIDNAAMRTAMPFLTCAKTAERGPSASSLSISTPRFIGPGCKIGAPGFIRAARAGVRQ